MSSRDEIKRERRVKLVLADMASDIPTDSMMRALGWLRERGVIVWTDELELVYPKSKLSEWPLYRKREAS